MKPDQYFCYTRYLEELDEVYVCKYSINRWGNNIKFREYIGIKCREYVGIKCREYVGIKCREYVGIKCREYIGKWQKMIDCCLKKYISLKTWRNKS